MEGVGSESKERSDRTPILEVLPFGFPREKRLQCWLYMEDPYTHRRSIVVVLYVIRYGKERMSM